MSFHPILAHGALGNWDEIVFISIAAIFLLMMGISWVRSRASTPVAKTETPVQPVESASEPESSDHFTLQ